MRLAFLSPDVQLSIWAWFAVLLPLGLSRTVNALYTDYSTYNPDSSLNAAIVSVVHESDLSAIVTSIHQLEHTFNADYQYDWVFFSAEPLSDTFRSETSNATRAACLYEVIPREHWRASGADGHDGRPTAGGTAGGRHWNLGSFARENRMRDYDWFWRVEPGAKFDHHIKFDVFRFMRDNNIEFGFTKPALDRSDLDTLSPYLQSFIDDNLSLLHEDAQFSYRGHGSNGVGRERDRSDADALMRALFEADDEQVATDDEDEQDDGGDEEEGDWYLAADFSAWLVKMCGNTLHPNFELGSLAFLRSPSHQALIDHFNEAPYTPIHDVPVHSLSASMFLPKQSVWNFRRKSHDSRATPTPGPGPNGDPDYGATLVNWDSLTEEMMRPHHAMWDILAADFARREKEPKTNLGHTAIDERNFLMTASNGRYLTPEDCISCQTAIAAGEKEEQGLDTDEDE